MTLASVGSDRSSDTVFNRHTHNFRGRCRSVKTLGSVSGLGWGKGGRRGSGIGEFGI